MKKYILYTIILLVFSSCASEFTMIEVMNSTSLKKNKTDFSSLHTEQEKRITIESSNIVGIDSVPSLKNNKSLFVPLLFVNIWNFQYDGKIGYSNISENLNFNMKEFVLESSLKTDSLSTLSQSKVTITLDSINSNVQYVNKGVLIFMLLNYAMFSKDYILPSDLALSLSYKIENSNGVIQSNTLSLSEKIPLKNNRKLLFKNFVSEYNNQYLTVFNELIQKACNEVSDKLIQTGENN